MNVQSRYSVIQPMELVRTFFLHINNGTGANVDHVAFNAFLAESNVITVTKNLESLKTLMQQ